MSDSEELRAFMNAMARPTGVPWLDKLSSTYLEAMLDQLEAVVNDCAEMEDWHKGLAVWTELTRFCFTLSEMAHFARGRMEATQFRATTKRSPSKRADKADAKAREALEQARLRAKHWGEGRDRG